MTRKQKLAAAIATAERFHDYSQRLKGFLRESEEKIEMLEIENGYLKTRCTLFTWDKEEYKRLIAENKELKLRVKALELLVDTAMGCQSPVRK